MLVKNCLMMKFFSLSLVDFSALDGLSHESASNDSPSKQFSAGVSPLFNDDSPISSIHSLGKVEHVSLVVVVH